MRQAAAAAGQLIARGGGGPSLALRYAAFALVATLANLAAQAAVVRLAPDAPLWPSIAAGTAAGFAVKYYLDKRWIFFDGYDGGRREAGKLLLYAAFSVATTAVFWAFEVAFWVLWRTEFAKYAGAALGLGIGYVAKYALDRRYTFGGRRA